MKYTIQIFHQGYTMILERYFIVLAMIAINRVIRAMKNFVQTIIIFQENISLGA